MILVWELVPSELFNAAAAPAVGLIKDSGGLVVREFLDMMRTCWMLATFCQLLRDLKFFFWSLRGSIRILSPTMACLQI